MPKDFGGKIFYTKEEAEALGMNIPEHGPERTAELMARFAAAKKAAVPLPEGTPTYKDSINYRDDLIGTEFEGWTVDRTGAWRDRHGRRAYDDAGARIRYPEDDTRPDPQPTDEPQPTSPASPSPEQPETDTDDGGISFHI